MSDSNPTDRMCLRCATTLVVVVAAAFVLSFGVVYGTYAASDTDPFGYVSEADLIAHGSLSMPNDLARQMPWPFAEESFTPAGYGTRADHTIVPTYPPGLPLLMAGFQRLAGRESVYYVVPLLGALAVLMTGRLGHGLGGPAIGVSAAVLLASSPIFLHQVVQPVSDVAATAWWVTALSLTVAGGPVASFGAGLAASMATLTRPNLVPLAAVLAGYLAWSAVRRGGEGRHEVRRLAIFCGAALPGCLAVAWFNAALYGGPLSTGYGDLGKLYSLSHLWPNLQRYPLWLVQLHSPLIVVGVLYPLVHRKTRAGSGAGPMGRDRAWPLLVWVAVVVLSYLVYVPWDGWGYLRFLLPAIPVCIVLSASVVHSLPNRATRRAATGTTAGVTAIGAVATAAWVAWQAYQVVGSGVFTLRDAEQRYVDVGRYLDRATPRESVFITGAHSGSLLYYTGRRTIQYDKLGAGWLDEAVKILTERGYRLYIVLEDAEEGPFRERFGGQTLLGRLDWPPAVQRTEPVQVRIYDPAERPRYMAGEPMRTGDIRPDRTPLVRRRDK